MTTVRIAGFTTDELGEAATDDDVERGDALLREELQAWLNEHGHTATADVVSPDWPHLRQGIEVHRMDVRSEPDIDIESGDVEHLRERAFDRFCSGE